MANTKKITWAVVRKEAPGSGFFVSYNGDDEDSIARLAAERLILRDNNGWPCATKPAAALALVRNAKTQFD
jgi:hypothetical protein